MRNRLLPIHWCAAVLLTLSDAAFADVVTQWNDAALSTIKKTSTSPPQASRVLAMLHVAVYDAVNGITATHEPYLVNELPEDFASPEAAGAQAGYQMLMHLFPEEHAGFDRLHAEQLAQLPDSTAKRAGVKYGKLVASRVIESRENDGSKKTKRYVSGVHPGQWRPTAPDFKPALLPHWSEVTPFGIESGSQFRPANPPSLTSEEYGRDVAEVQRIGSAVSASRTMDQTHVALFWADGSGTVTPPGHWNQIARTVAESRGHSLAENARLFALLNIALADAGIACWDMKYSCDLWRPITAIQEAHLDDNPLTQRDPLWRPLLTTPPFPTCTSGHSTFSGAAAEMLARFFGTDSVSFSSTSEEVSGSRSFQRFSQAATEAGRSRIYGGIHFEFDNQSGLASGKAISKFVFANFMRPVKRQLAAKPAGIDDGGWRPVPKEEANDATAVRTENHVSPGFAVPPLESSGSIATTDLHALEPAYSDAGAYGPITAPYSGSILQPAVPAAVYDFVPSPASVPFAAPWVPAPTVPGCGCSH